eukprot:Opistho-2@54829
MASSARLLVVGGSGFIGAAVCREAVLRGFGRVVALSRHGQRPSADAWCDGVEWVRGDALDPTSYRDHVEGATCVVHAVGTLLENTFYKALVKPDRLAKGGFGVLGAGSASHVATGGGIGERTTYERMNRDSAVEVARAAVAAASVRSFVFLSAAAPKALASFLRYVSTKREAEEAISGMGSLRTVILRPGLVYSDDDPVTAPLALAGRVAGAIAGPVFRALPRSLVDWNDLYIPPVNVRTLARAAVSGALDASASGIFCGDDIERLADAIVRVQETASAAVTSPPPSAQSMGSGGPCDLRQIPIV